MFEHPSSGTSQAAMGIAHLLVMALEKEGVPKAEATRKIWMVDSKGLIVKVLSAWRPECFLTPAAVGSGQDELSKGQTAQTGKRAKKGQCPNFQSKKTHCKVALMALAQKL